MAEKEVTTRVKNRRDTEANWSSNNPVLLNGEIALVDTTNGETRAKIGNGTSTFSQLPYSDAFLREMLEAGSPAPWKYVYDANGEALGMVKDCASYTETVIKTPYKATWGGEITDPSNAYGDSESATYAQYSTSTTAQSGAIYIDTEIPIGASISSMTINAKIGSSNISSAVWTTRTYAVKCGNNTLASGTLQLGTGGKLITVTVSDMSLITSPIISIEFTAQTTTEQSLRIFGADVTATYTATQKYVPLVQGDDTRYATKEDVYSAMPTTAADIGAADESHEHTISELGLTSESWTFTLEDDTTVTKSVVVLA